MNYGNLRKTEWQRLAMSKVALTLYSIAIDTNRVKKQLRFLTLSLLYVRVVNEKSSADMNGRAAVRVALGAA